MLAHIKDFMLNIFIIFAPLLLYPYLLKLRNKPRVQRLLVFVLYAGALVATMSFPIQLDGATYDFRSVPLTVGALYGGWPVSILLYATLLAIRYYFGAPHILLYCLSLLPTFLLAFLAVRRFGELRLVPKIAVAVALCTLIKLVAFIIYFSGTGQLPAFAFHFWETAQTYLLQGVIVALCVYLIESLDRHQQMQEELIRGEKMKIVGDMAASVAHEIRNPLTTVRGFIQLLATVPLTETKKIEYKNLCLDELDRAERIISDYLSLAKPDPEQIETIDLNEELEYLSNVLLTYANYNDIQIRVHASRESGLTATGDRSKFRQALVNIGKNAIEAMENGGTLELRTDKRSDGPAIVVSDSGIGMTAEQVKRLGTPYYSTKTKGTGLGTMVSFSIIKKMNGRIRIKSDLGRGTEFAIVFPERSWSQERQSG